MTEANGMLDHACVVRKKEVLKGSILSVLIQTILVAYVEDQQSCTAKAVFISRHAHGHTHTPTAVCRDDHYLGLVENIYRLYLRFIEF